MAGVEVCIEGVAVYNRALCDIIRNAGEISCLNRRGSVRNARIQNSSVIVVVAGPPQTLALEGHPLILVQLTGIEIVAGRLVNARFLL